MKNKKYKRFSAYCGVAKVFHEEEEIYVAYSDYMKCLKQDLGVVVGKGKTEIEALRMALVNLTKNIKKMSDEFDRFEEKLKKLKISSGPLNFDDNPIIPIESLDHKFVNDDVHYFPSGRYYNASVIVNSNDEIFLGDF